VAAAKTEVSAGMKSRIGSKVGKWRLQIPQLVSRPSAKNARRGAPKKVRDHAAAWTSQPKIAATARVATTLRTQRTGRPGSAGRDGDSTGWDGDSVAVAGSGMTTSVPLATWPIARAIFRVRAASRKHRGKSGSGSVAWTALARVSRTATLDSRQCESTVPGT